MEEWHGSTREEWSCEQPAWEKPKSSPEMSQYVKVSADMWWDRQTREDSVWKTAWKEEPDEPDHTYAHLEDTDSDDEFVPALLSQEAALQVIQNAVLHARDLDDEDYKLFIKRQFRLWHPDRAVPRGYSESLAHNCSTFLQCLLQNFERDNDYRYDESSTSEV